MALIGRFIQGAKEHIRHLTRAREINDAVVAAMYAAGQLVEIDAEHSITSGSISGANHVPSLPGQPPNADTRLLDTNIETTIRRRGRNPVVQVMSNAPYAMFLEFGTSRMAERPYLRPALQRNRAQSTRMVEEAVRRVVSRN